MQAFANLIARVTRTAFRVGYSDGLAWDLAAFGSAEDVARDVEGWTEATIQAIGVSDFRQRCGIDSEDLSEQDDAEVFGVACRQYNRGAYAGATATDVRTGLAPAGNARRAERR